jgi:Skp family chaperone for outer membrane proteins
LSEIGEKMETANYEDDEKITEELNSNRDSLLSLVAKCHDGHQELLLAEEQKLQDSVHEWASEYLTNFRHNERERNRTRVLELNYFLDSMKREVEEIEVIPDNQFEDDGML